MRQLLEVLFTDPVATAWMFFLMAGILAHAGLKGEGSLVFFGTLLYSLDWIIPARLESLVTPAYFVVLIMTLAALVGSLWHRLMPNEFKAAQAAARANTAHYWQEAYQRFSDYKAAKAAKKVTEEEAKQAKLWQQRPNAAPINK